MSMKELVEYLDETGSKKLRLFIFLLVVYLVFAVCLGMYWSITPQKFAVEERAESMLQAKGLQPARGSVTTATLAKVAGALLRKPGGYMSNDIFPPGVWLDNVTSWEFGVLVQVRDMARALRKDMSRSQSQSTEDKDLAKSEPLFHFDNNSWAMPASESEYKQGIRSLERYLARLSEGGKKQAQFHARADNLSNWLGDVETRLGSISQRLGASVGSDRVSIAFGQDAAAVPDTGVTRIKTPWLEIDDVFHEARGTAWALLHLLRAIEVDFAEVLHKKNAMVSLRQIIRELEASQETLWSPMILNGSGFGVLANHSLVMTSYMSRANAGVIQLRELLSQG